MLKMINVKHKRTRYGFIYTAYNKGKETASTFVTFIQDKKYVNTIKDDVRH